MIFSLFILPVSKRVRDTSQTEDKTAGEIQKAGIQAAGVAPYWNTNPTEATFAWEQSYPPDI